MYLVVIARMFACVFTSLRMCECIYVCCICVFACVCMYR